MRRMVLAAALLLASSGLAESDGRCDLNGLVGYQIVFAKPVTAYIQGGKRVGGYIGCEPDRVLVFGDNTGVRCKEVALQRLDSLPTGYLFARKMDDLKLCVEGQVFEVSPTN